MIRAYPITAQWRYFSAAIIDKITHDTMLMANHSFKAPWDSWIQTLGQAKTRRKGSEAPPSQAPSIPLTKSSTTLMIAFEWKNVNATDHSGVTFFLEKGGNDPAFPVSPICLSFPLSFNFQHKPGQCEPLLCRLDGMWVSRKVPGAAGCSHFSLAGVSWAGSENWCEAPSSHLLWCLGRARLQSSTPSWHIKFLFQYAES